MLKLRQIVRVRSPTRGPPRTMLTVMSRRYRSSTTSRGNDLLTAQDLSADRIRNRKRQDPQKNQYHQDPSPASQRPLFDKVLIANRGEISCRVIRTCKSMGIPTVALYSVADGPNALHAKSADEAYPIGFGSAPSESYLLQDEVLEIAQRSGAKAIHPGYGFLSENAEFCKKIQTETNGDIAFVGPPPSAIAAMGSKSKSKAIMEAAGVTTAPGFYGDSSDEQDPLHLMERAVEDVGFPLLIKAVMGGGGKGMRLVWSESEFLDNLEACKRESLNAFGDDTVLLERYLVQPRHIEVQVVADEHGNVVSLHERDCSLQRRHQKIIEEAPASDLSETVRRKLGEMGCKAARAVGYVNAGTVEFLLESNNTNNNTEQDDAGFYFCEMNTRLQVEHPITELITGIDLVEWQLLVAAGKPLPIQESSDIPNQGHAFEARIYAEKPGDGKFLPASGTVWYHDPPALPNGVGVEGDSPSSNGTTIRVDTGIQTGQAVGVDYDPMICKLIVHDTSSREKALDQLVEALKDYRIAGIPTNIDFLINCAQHETFRSQGATNTGFLDDHLPEVLPPTQPTNPTKAIAMASLATMLVLEGKVGILDLEASRRTQSSPWNSLSGSWRTFGTPNQTLILDDGTTIDCTFLRDGSYEIKVAPNEAIDGDENEATFNDNSTDVDNDDTATIFHVTGTLSSDHQMDVVINGSEKVSMVVALREVDGQFQVCLWPQSASLRNEGHYFWEVMVPNPRVASPSAQASNDTSKQFGSGKILSPMPGKISKISCRVGDVVQEGDVLFVMEAMKMEHTVQAISSGVVESIDCQLGVVVAEQTVLAMVVAEAHQSDEEQSEGIV